MFPRWDHHGLVEHPIVQSDLVVDFDKFVEEVRVPLLPLGNSHCIPDVGRELHKLFFKELDFSFHRLLAFLICNRDLVDILCGCHAVI